MSGRGASLIMLVAGIFGVQGAVAQQVPFPIPDTSPLIERALETQTMVPQEAPERETAFLPDRVVDRDDYVLGPNDQVSIAIMGYSNAFYQLLVTIEGSILVPKVGRVPVAGLTLTRAEDRVRDRARAVYPSADVDLALSGPRVFKVFLVGDIPESGPKPASSVTRVSELIPKLREPEVEEFGRTLEAPLTGTSNRDAMLGKSESGVLRDREEAPVEIRNVVLVRATGDTLAVDLARFRRTGDLRDNPTLREGDILLVPALDETVEVYGRVFFPGIYEHRPGETLAGFLEIVNGNRGFPSDAHDVVVVTRFTGAREREHFEFNRSEATGERGSSFILQPFDAVFVPAMSDYKVQKTATVEGEVLYPGTYPIRPDTTTVGELLAMAGGVSARASVVSARLVRKRLPARDESAGSLEEVAPELLSEDERRILQVRRGAEPDRVVIDLAALHQPGRDAADVALRDGDRLMIPEKRGDVTVIGAVREPGILRFEAGLDIDGYVDRAGGYTDRADEGDVLVLKGDAETRLSGDEVSEIDPGDTIIVPYEKDRDWLDTVRTVSTVATGVISVVLSVIVATR